MSIRLFYHSLGYPRIKISINSQSVRFIENFMASFWVNHCLNAATGCGQPLVDQTDAAAKLTDRIMFPGNKKQGHFL